MAPFVSGGAQTIVSLELVTSLTILDRGARTAGSAPRIKPPIETNSQKLRLMNGLMYDASNRTFMRFGGTGIIV
jgi:hypothetical protein